MSLITSKDDSRMKKFQEYRDSKVGFVGFEKLLFDSLVAALTRRVGELECQKKALQQVAEEEKGEPGETGDESTG